MATKPKTRFVIKLCSDINHMNSVRDKQEDKGRSLQENILQMWKNGTFWTRL